MDIGAFLSSAYPLLSRTYADIWIYPTLQDCDVHVIYSND